MRSNLVIHMQIAQPLGPFPRWERIETIQTSANVAMPTDAELCALQTRSIHRLDNPTFIDDSCEKSPFYGGIAAHLSGARTNHLHGMFLGTTLTGQEIWGSLVEGHDGHFATDAPHRALVQVVVVIDSTNNGVRTVILRVPSGLDVVATWDAGIVGGSLAERYAFAYDALVEQAKFECI